MQRFYLRFLNLLLKFYWDFKFSAMVCGFKRVFEDFKKVYVRFIFLFKNFKQFILGLLRKRKLGKNENWEKKEN